MKLRSLLARPASLRPLTVQPPVDRIELIDPIEGTPPRIESCEPRLALSASLAGDLLLDLLGGTIDSPLDPATDQFAPDLAAQAAEVRELHNLTGRGQTIAVIDSGVAWDHLALGGGFGPGYRVVGGWDFAENDADPYDDGPAGYHGTHVAGVLAGESDFLTGIAPEADLVALRVFDDQGAGKLEWIESALQWVRDNRLQFASPITAVNLSVGAALTEANRLEAHAMLEDELQQLREEGVLVFAAAGNGFAAQHANGTVEAAGGAGSANGVSSTDGAGVLFPASSPSVVAVTSIDDGGLLSGFAQREPGILAARGEAITSSIPEHVLGWDGTLDDVVPLSGSSMATPQVTAASVLLRQAMWDQGLDPTADEILERLRDTSRSGVDPITGVEYRAIDLQRAIAEVIGNGSPTDGGGEGAEAEHPTGGETTAGAIASWTGTAADETVVLDLREGGGLRVGGVTYRVNWEASLASPWVIDAGGGVDSLTIFGSDQAERLEARPSGNAEGLPSRLTGNDFAIELHRFENIRFVGGGGPDRVTLYDGPGDDTFRSRPGEASLQGPGFRFEAIGVSRTYVHATGGGQDTAFLYDSSDDDLLSVRPQFASLRSDSASQFAYGFERVYAYAENGGTNRAELFDSPGNDVVSISANRSILSSHGYQASVRGFDSVVAHSIYGGDDVARIYAEETSSRWHATADMTQWTAADGTTRAARGFSRALAFEEFEPVELRPQASSPLAHAMLTDPLGERLRQEAEALRMLFADLAQSPS